MFNPKISGIFAGIGFVLSFVAGLFSGALFPLILIRALIFATVFFALASLGYGAIQMYLPELFAKDSGDVPSLGAQVDISVGDDEEAAEGISLESGETGDALNEFFENPGDSGADTLDQTGEGVYTEEGGIEESFKSVLPEDSRFSSEETDSVDMLPDFDSMSGVFSSGSAPAKGGGDSFGTSSPASSSGAAGGQAKKKTLDEAFNVQEMASAIRTILKRENKG
jgi:hypothetical protein